MSLISPRFKQADYQRSIWTATVEHGFDAIKLMDPKFWANVANQMKVGDRVEIGTDSREWFAEVYVLEVGANFARVALMRMVALNDSGAAIPNDQDFTIEFKGPVKLWCVIRKSDKAHVYDKLPSKDAAMAKLAAHTRPIAA